MTTNWKRTKTADGAGADALRGGSVRARRARVELAVRALRWRRDAVCRDAAADDAFRGAEADPAGSSITRTIFFSSRIELELKTGKETKSKNKEKGKQTTNVNNFATKPVTLA